MNKEVKLVKDYLRLRYPDNYFSVRYHRPYSYLNGGDGLIISTNLEYDTLFMCLREITEHIVIYPYKQASMLSDGVFGKLFGQDTDIEFISIITI